MTQLYSISPTEDEIWWNGGLAAALALPDSVHVSGVTLACAESQIDALAPYLPVQLQRASVKRRSEYLAGRLCASAALRAAGCVGAPPPMGTDSLPLWPDGCLGSITHGAGAAVAAVTRSGDGSCALLGIDVEAWIEPSSVDGIGALVALEGELDMFSGYTRALALTLLFSAKESLFKALYPTARRFMDFSAARMTAVESGALILTLTVDWHAAWPAGTALRVQFATRGQRVYTALYRC